MYTSIFQNSYIVAIFVFIILCLVFYFLEIGFSTTIENGEVVKKFSWKYPLAISLIVWLVWYFVLYPPKDTKIAPSSFGSALSASLSPTNVAAATQKINLANWN